MAAAKEKEYTVEERLKALYELQTLLSEIDRIKTLRGELPLEVKDLEDSIVGMETRLENYKSNIKESQAVVAAQKVDMQNAQALIEKYTEQQNNVRNNKEFDHLSKEIEYQGLEIESIDKKAKDLIKQITDRKAEVEELQKLLSDRSLDLQDKRNELEEIISETRQDEEKIREKVKKLEQNIEPRLLNSFKRIRKNARNGLGIVYIQRDACGGCFNKIPPQRQLDIKLRKKIIVCEYCGRVMIDPELAGIE
ncbi:MAG: C4-type zinc ribbon domain-containing protein [Bacteroidales bacterium]